MIVPPPPAYSPAAAPLASAHEPQQQPVVCATAPAQPSVTPDAVAAAPAAAGGGDTTLAIQIANKNAAEQLLAERGFHLDDLRSLSADADRVIALEEMGLTVLQRLKVIAALRYTA